jgi:hypothetical protein
MLKGGYPENVRAAIGWTGSTVIFGLLPMILSLVGFLIVNRPQEILVLLTNGEVLMVSNTIVCSAAILLGKDRSPTGKHFGRVPYIQFATIIVAATSFNYGVIRTLQIIHYTNINGTLVVSMTVGLFLVGCIYALIVVTLDESLEPQQNFEQVYDKAEAKLQEDFLSATGRVPAARARSFEKSHIGGDDEYRSDSND